MFTNRFMTAVLSITAFSAWLGIAASPGSDNGPALGKWEFTGKDSTGLAWKGTLTIEKLDSNRFDANRFHSMCSLEVESTDPTKGTKGLEAPCTYDAGTRTVSFSTGVSTVHSLSAVLSGDGRSLTQGKWTESGKGAKKGGEPGTGAVRAGNWSAKLKQ